MIINSDKDLARLFKQQTAINKAVVDGERIAPAISPVLQAVINADIGSPSLFRPLYQQITAFLDYNGWLKAYYPQFAITSRDFQPLLRKLTEKPQKWIEGLSGKLLLFYQHSFFIHPAYKDILLTACLAWEYISQRPTPSWRNKLKTQKSDLIRLGRPGKPKPHEIALGTLGIPQKNVCTKEYSRLPGFYIVKLPQEAKGIVGKDCQGQSPKEVWQHLKQLSKPRLAMHSEALQLVFTNPEYFFEWMDGERVPWLAMPGFKLSTPYGETMPYLKFIKGVWHSSYTEGVKYTRKAQLLLKPVPLSASPDSAQIGYGTLDLKAN